MITIYPTHTEKSNDEQSHFFEALSQLTGLKKTPFSCGRAAMVYGLRALGIGRMDEILVPPYLGHCVLSALARTSFPTMTPSHRTKIILVFHQFGYPQKISAIEKVASKNDWIILNDCANTIFSSCRGEPVINWGDFSVLSFAKLYPCTLGGGLISTKGEIQEAIETNHAAMSLSHFNRVNIAHETLEKAHKNLLGVEAQFEIEAVFGYLPELVAFPNRYLSLLPQTTQEIEEDTNHRRRLLNIVNSYFPDRVPDCSECDVVPFAIPVSGEPAQLELVSGRIKQELRVDVPVLHFDFAKNMLQPDYRKSLVIGCHKDWRENIVIDICEMIKRGRDVNQ